MDRSETQAKVDPELLRQMNDVAARDNPVEAVLMLRQSPSQIAASPERTAELTRQILKRVEDQIGVGPKQVNVFQNLGSFVVAAEPRFLRELLVQPEIASAVANRQPAEEFAPPEKSPPAKIQGKTAKGRRLSKSVRR